MGDFLKEILGAVRKPPRFSRQQEIEAQLKSFAADELEAHDMLPALLGRLEQNPEIAHYALYLRRALERVHNQTPYVEDYYGE